MDPSVAVVALDGGAFVSHRIAYELNSHRSRDNN